MLSVCLFKFMVMFILCFTMGENPLGQGYSQNVRLDLVVLGPLIGEHLHPWASP
jgi:hypothetical protein